MLDQHHLSISFFCCSFEDEKKRLEVHNNYRNTETKLIGLSQEVRYEPDSPIPSYANTVS